MKTFPDDQRKAMLAVKNVGPTVIERLQQVGYANLEQLRNEHADDILNAVSERLNSTCWRNSPQARQAIEGVLKLAARWTS